MNKLVSLLIITIFLVLSSCTTRITEAHLSNGSWYDRYGNVYRFNAGTLLIKPRHGELVRNIGSYEYRDNAFTIHCVADTNTDTEPITLEINVLSNSENIITLSDSFDICDNLQAVNTTSEVFELSNLESKFIDEGENLQRLELSINPSTGNVRSVTYSGSNELVIVNASSETEIIKLDSDQFKNLENLIKMIPLEEYDDQYNSYKSHSIFSWHVETNRISKTVQGNPPGLTSIFQYIHHLINKT